MPKFMSKTVVILCFVCAFIQPALSQTKAPEGAQVYFISPQNGATVKETFRVKFGLRGMGIAPAGVEKENTGHHHLLINTQLTGETLKEPIPADEQHVHFGGGQTETQITLPKGKHTLQLLVGDHNHIPHDKPIMSELITITVE